VTTRNRVFDILLGDLQNSAKIAKSGFWLIVGKLPDVIFSNRKSQFRLLKMYVYFWWYIIWRFGTFCGHLSSIYFPVLVYCTEKNLATLICGRVRGNRREICFRFINFNRRIFPTAVGESCNMYIRPGSRPLISRRTHVLDYNQCASNWANFHQLGDCLHCADLDLCKFKK
jgi:hypothetical protein